MRSSTSSVVARVPVVGRVTLVAAVVVRVSASAPERVSVPLFLVNPVTVPALPVMSPVTLPVRFPLKVPETVPLKVGDALNTRFPVPVVPVAAAR